MTKIILFKDEDEVSEAKIELMYEQDWDKIPTLWKKTRNMRRVDYYTNATKTLADIFNEWPLLKYSKAPILVYLDFDLLHPGKGNSMFTQWDEFAAKILEAYKSSIKNRHCKTDLAEIEMTTIPNKKDFLIMKVLHGLLKPPVCSNYSDKSQKKTFKASISDSQTSQFYLIEEMTSIHKEVERRHNNAAKYGLKVSPFVMIQNDFEEFHVYIDKNYYSFRSFIKAYDFCFKSFQVFNLEYPKESQTVWQFVAQYFYDIQSEVKAGNVTALIKSLK